MGAEASTSIGGVWGRLEGQVVDGQFPLHRFLGSSEHSGVFVTESAKLAPSEVALKLVALPVARVDSQLARWHTAAALSHPNLMRLLDVGRCNVASIGNLYAAMEYADQDLAQLLQRRALTEEEVREMLVPMLGALAYLHERKLVSGRLKPSNVLVVGDQLKLASDAIRTEGEVDDVKALSAYDPPEARDGHCSTASDVWALGVTICEALTRRQPLGLLGGAGTVVLPPDLPAAFGEIVAWCLRRQPQDRPDVAEIDAWLSGQPVEIGAAGSHAQPHAEVQTDTQARPRAHAQAHASASQAQPSTPPPSAARSLGVDARDVAAPAPAAASGSTTPVEIELAAGLEGTAPAKPIPAAPVTASVASRPAPATSAPPAPAAAPPSYAPPAQTAAPASRPAAATSSAPAARPIARATSAPPAQTISTARPASDHAPAIPAPRSQSAAPAPAAPPARVNVPAASRPAPAAPVNVSAPKPAVAAPSKAAPPPVAASGTPPARAAGLAVSKSVPPPSIAASVTAKVAAAYSKPAWVPAASKSKLIAPSRPPESVNRARIDEGDVVVQPRRSLISLALGVVVVIAVVWGGIRLFGGNESSQPSAEVASASPGASGREQPASPSTSDGPSTSPEQGAAAAPPTNAKSRTNANAKVPVNPKAALNGKLTARSTAPGAATNASSAAVQQFIPEVPPRARRTIRGNVRVSVRVIVERDGSVFAALAERRSPSRYFERVAIDAAKKWTFTPTDADAQRLMLVKFAFSRDGTTAEAVALN